MNKAFKKILLVCKKSAYSIYFLERKIQLTGGGHADLQKEIKRFKKAHDEHHGAVREAERILRKYGMSYTKCIRGRTINYGRFDLIITLGGDGTFLEAARNIKDQVIIGVNSAPGFSVGQLCVGNTRGFERLIRRLMERKFAVVQWPRLRMNLEGHIRPVDCVNDILICHSNPAAMSRYYLKIGSIKEEQRSSGLWVASPAGSTGAIRSAGGTLLKGGKKNMQYMPRELYCGFKRNYHHKGGVLRAKQTLSVVSLMRNGMIFADGTHVQMKFPFNARLQITLSPASLRTIRIT